jgi:hypothetical protein
MKKIIFFSSIVTLLFLASCKKDHGGYYSNLAFWTASNCSPNPITVTINGQSAVMTEYFPSVVPSCGTQGCANFSLGSGTYNYSATNGDTTWTGSVSVDKGTCTLQQLFCSTGNVTFWVDSAANNMQVTINGGTANVTTAFPTTTPSCGTRGCANFTLHPGTYTYTAITSTNIGYTGSVRVGNDSCTLVKLY